MEIRQFDRRQTDAMVDLLQELFSYYIQDARTNRREIEEHLLKNPLAEDSGLQLITAASHDGSLLGFAAIGFVHSIVDPRPSSSRQCFLKELYVAHEHRGKGLGLKLMQWIARHAIENGCARIDWPVKSENYGGIKFYESLGAHQVTDRLSYRISGEALAALADAKLRHRGQIGS